MSSQHVISDDEINWYWIVSDFMRLFKEFPKDVAQDLCNLYPKECHLLQQEILHQLNKPAVAALLRASSV